MFCDVVLDVLSGFAITTLKKRELIAFTSLSSSCRVAVVTTWFGLWYDTVAFHGHTLLLSDIK